MAREAGLCFAWVVTINEHRSPVVVAWSAYGPTIHCTLLWQQPTIHIRPTSGLHVGNNFYQTCSHGFISGIQHLCIYSSTLSHHIMSLYSVRLQVSLSDVFQEISRSKARFSNNLAYYICDVDLVHLFCPNPHCLSSFTPCLNLIAHHHQRLTHALS